MIEPPGSGAVRAPTILPVDPTVDPRDAMQGTML
jgi:hypothetical protein